MIRAHRAWRVAAGVLAAAAAPVLPAAAQDRPTAEVLFEQGRRLQEQGRDAEACARFEESQRLDPAVGTLLNLGVCYEKLGRTASAWAALRDASARAALAGEQRRAEAARAKADSLEPQLAKLAIASRGAGEVAGLEVRRDDVVVAPSSWGDPFPVDPGPHVISAQAPGFLPWSERVEVPAGPVLAMVFVPKLEPAMPPPPVHPAQMPQLPPMPPPHAAETRAAEPSAARTIGLVMAAAGGGGLVSAAIVGTGAVLKKSRGEIDEARGWAQAFDWIAVPSALAAVAGAAVFFAAGAARAPSGTAVVPVFDPHGFSFVATRAF
jgi:serine/threonine-protein kinase